MKNTEEFKIGNLVSFTTRYGIHCEGPILKIEIRKEFQNKKYAIIKADSFGTGELNICMIPLKALTLVK